MAAKKATKKDQRHVITLRVSSALHKRLRVTAAHEGTTIQALIMQSIENGQVVR